MTSTAQQPARMPTTPIELTPTAIKYRDHEPCPLRDSPPPRRQTNHYLLEQARAAEARDNLGARVAVSPISRKPAALPGHELPPVIPVEPASARPGDIAVFADHTAIVAGHGHLIGHPGRLSDQTGPGLQGVFRLA